MASIAKSLRNIGTFLAEVLESLFNAFAHATTVQTSHDNQLVDAVTAGNHDLATRLLQEGASPYALNAKGQNCWQIAMIQGDREMENRLTTGSRAYRKPQENDHET